MKKYWEQFHIVTREHFYHAGAKEKNRQPIVEALVMNFEPTQPVDISVEIDELETEVPQMEFLMI